MSRQLLRFIHHVWLAPLFALAFLAFLELFKVTPDLVRDDPYGAARRLRIHVPSGVPGAHRFEPHSLQRAVVYSEGCLVWWRWLPSIGLFSVFLAWRSGLL